MKIISIIGAIVCWVGTKLPLLNIIEHPSFWDYMSISTKGAMKIAFMMLAVFLVVSVASSVLGNVTLINVSNSFIIILLLVLGGIIYSKIGTGDFTSLVASGYWTMLGGAAIGVYGSSK